MNKIRMCPVCQGRKRTKLNILDGFEICKCRSCKHVFVNNITQDTSSSLDVTTKDVDITATHFRHHMIVSLIENKFPELNTNSDEIINCAEIGSGIGRLGYLLLGKKTLKYCGFEPSFERYAYSKQYNVNVKNETFKEDAGNYDVIIMDNVLEHVANPAEVFKSVSKSLKKGGIFINIVPNRHDIRRFFPKFRDKHFWLPRWHINYFSMNDLKYLSKLNGMSIHDFGLDTIGHGNNYLKIKTLLDNFGIHVGGLYTYAIKL